MQEIFFTVLDDGQSILMQVIPPSPMGQATSAEQVMWRLNVRMPVPLLEGVEREGRDETQRMEPGGALRHIENELRLSVLVFGGLRPIGRRTTMTIACSSTPWSENWRDERQVSLPRLDPAARWLYI